MKWGEGGGEVVLGEQGGEARKHVFYKARRTLSKVAARDSVAL